MYLKIHNSNQGECAEYLTHSGYREDGEEGKNNLGQTLHSITLIWSHATESNGVAPD